MSTRIRLRRMGSKGRPFYRVVVADQRSPRDGRFIENIGRYHPLNDPSVIEIDQDRALHWLRVGAQPSDQVRNLMQKVGIWDTFVADTNNFALCRRNDEARASREGEALEEGAGEGRRLREGFGRATDRNVCAGSPRCGSPRGCRVACERGAGRARV